MIPVHRQWNTTESVVITVSWECQLLIGYCNTVPVLCNIDRIERFLVAKRRHPRSKTISQWFDRLQVLTEETRGLNRYRGGESIYASCMWNRNGVVACNQWMLPDCIQEERQITILVTNATEVLNTEPVMNSSILFSFHRESSLPESSHPMNAMENCLS